MTDGPQERSKNLSADGIFGRVDTCPSPETRLGANLEAEIVPEDPDDRQYWLWDVDDLEEEEPCP